MGRAALCAVSASLCGRDGWGGVPTSNYRCSDVSLASTFGRMSVRVPGGESLNRRRREGGDPTKNTPLFVPGGGRGGGSMGKKHNNKIVLTYTCLSSF